MNKLDEVQLSSLSSSGSSSPQYSGPTNDTKNPEAMNSSLLMDVSNSGSVPYDLTTLIDIDMSSYSPKVPSANEPGNSWQWRNPSLKNPCYAGIGFNFKFNLWVIIDEALCYHLSLENAGIRLCTFRKICITPLIDFVITAVCPLLRVCYPISIVDTRLLNCGESSYWTWDLDISREIGFDSNFPWRFDWTLSAWFRFLYP